MLKYRNFPLTLSPVDVTVLCFTVCWMFKGWNVGVETKKDDEKKKKVVKFVFVVVVALFFGCNFLSLRENKIEVFFLLYVSWDDRNFDIKCWNIA